MNSNQAYKVKTLEECLYSIDEIESAIQNREHIFELFRNHDSLGYISLYDLKDFQNSKEYDFSYYFLRNIDSIDKKLFYEHPFFQRRKPQMVQENMLLDPEQDYYLLLKGQKSGPFKIYDIKQKLDDKDVLVTDLISNNAGHTWTKVYQMEGLDRRTLKENDALPGLPNKDLFIVNDVNEQKLDPNIEAMTDFAYLGNVKRGKAIEREREEYFEEQISKKNNSSVVYKFLFIFSVAGIVYVGNNLKNSLRTPFANNSTDESRIGEQSESGHDSVNGDAFNSIPPAANHNPTFQNQNMEARRMAPVRTNNSPRSFMDTQKFKNSNDELVPASPSNDDSYYYNDSAPIELDPVRSQVSRETSEGNTGIESVPASTPGNDPLFNPENDN